MKKNFIHAQMWQEDTFRPSVFDSEEIQGSTSISRMCRHARLFEMKGK